MGVGSDHGVVEKKVSVGLGFSEKDLLVLTSPLRLLDMVKECFGIAVARNVDDIKPDHLPVILIVYKAKGSVDVRNIIQGAMSFHTQ